ncbi:tyrosine--tRNA ligase, partial [candidate division WWE3 bacterium]|nr:tyrosine--tRNA ligase [candidate division WWE3 bacterium]
MSKVSTDKEKIKDILTRGVHEIFTYKELEEKLLSGKQLHIKLGIDVTGPLIHLGHAVVQRKIRDFQELGHRVTLIIGDFTTLIGDHSDKVDMRDETNTHDIAENEKTYVEQFFKTVIPEQVEIRHNSEWLKPLDFNQIINLAKQFTVSQMLDRETFMLRYKANKPIGLDEFLYPLMQGYDSVVLKADVEMGGTDQTFNLLAGRKLMPAFNLKPQSAVVMKLLTGSDGRPMGKSLKNFIPVTASAIDMYGMVMSIVDEVIFDYFELSTRIPLEDIEKMKKEMNNGANPMIFKKMLAEEIVTFYHSTEDAKTAARVFEETVQNKEISEELFTQSTSTGSQTILDFIRKELGNKFSSGEIKRTISQGGLELNGNKVTEPNSV